LGRVKRTKKPRSFVLFFVFFFVFFFFFFFSSVSPSPSVSRTPLWKKSSIHLRKKTKQFVRFLEATRENKRKKLASLGTAIAQESAHRTARTRSSWTHRSLHR
jgi:hypothetical protein